MQTKIGVIGGSGVYEIDAEYCDMFGPNATVNPNGYLKRV